MKPIQLNPSGSPSVSSTHDNPCFDSDTQTAALNAFADDGVSYLLPYAQFLYAEKSSNPELEKKPDAPAEQMLIRFACADVIVRGSGLKRVAQGIQKYELKFVKSADQRLAVTLNTHITSVAVTLAREDV
jgi:hypothetical protein